MDVAVAENRADCDAVHSELRRYADRAEQRHEELIRRLDANGVMARLGLDAIRNDLTPEIRAAHNRANDAHRRIDTWEARAEGATWVSKWLPTGLAGALGALATYVATGKWPPH